MDDKFGQLLQSLNPQQSNVGYPRPSQFDNNPSLGLGRSGLTSHPSSTDVPSRWFRLDKAVIEAIDLGNFNINQLPKLQREESACNRCLAKTPEGFRMSLDGSKFELITTRIRLQSSFPNMQLLLSAGQVTSLCAFNITQNTASVSSFGPKDSSIAHSFIPGMQFSNSLEYWFHLDSDPITDIIMSTLSRSLNTSLGPTISPSQTIDDYGSNSPRNWNR